MKEILGQIAERKIPPLRIIQSKAARMDVHSRLNLREHLERDSTEVFWAGRNFAMRRSARVAA